MCQWCVSGQWPFITNKSECMNAFIWSIISRKTYNTTSHRTNMCLMRNLLVFFSGGGVYSSLQMPRINTALKPSCTLNSRFYKAKARKSEKQNTARSDENLFDSGRSARTSLSSEDRRRRSKKTANEHQSYWESLVNYPGTSKTLYALWCQSFLLTGSCCATAWYKGASYCRFLTGVSATVICLSLFLRSVFSWVLGYWVLECVSLFLLYCIFSNFFRVYLLYDFTINK